MDDMKNKPDSYWRKKLSPEQYKVMRQRGTEAPGTGEYVDYNEVGTYCCAACPAFYAEAAKGRVELKDDNAFGMQRTEIICARCGSHLGHLFEGDPVVEEKGGKHYCVNSCTLRFEPKTAA
jgi:peptide-methionine (R)-S-oxide reductase